jgi:membrane protein insertase Oxa1/YidC/SpoIIIJ
MDRTQRILFMFLPLGFVFFILSGSITFPTGLLIYWVTTNLWTVGQGLVTRRLVPKTKPKPEAVKRSSRTPPRETIDGGEPAPAPTTGSAPAPAAAPGPPRRVRRKKRRAKR